MTCCVFAFKTRATLRAALLHISRWWTEERPETAELEIGNQKTDGKTTHQRWLSGVQRVTAEVNVTWSCLQDLCYFFVPFLLYQYYLFFVHISVSFQSIFHPVYSTGFPILFWPSSPQCQTRFLSIAGIISRLVKILVVFLKLIKWILWSSTTFWGLKSSIKYRQIQHHLV